MGLSEKDKTVYLEGLKKYQKRGVAIYIDGVESKDSDLDKILCVKEDTGFYMGDYIEDPGTGKLKQIRFEKINLRKGDADRSE